MGVHVQFGGVDKMKFSISCAPLIFADLGPTSFSLKSIFQLTLIYIIGLY